MSAGKKTTEEKLFHWKVCNVLGKIFYCIRKCFIMWDVQSHSIKGDQKLIWKVGVFVTGCKNKKVQYFWHQ